MEAFTCIKDNLTSTTINIAPDWSRTFELMCNGSGAASGAVFGQQKNKMFHPAYYASKALNVAFTTQDISYM